jgi:hypothetical protein
VQLRRSKLNADQDKTLEEFTESVETLTFISQSINTELSDHLTLLSTVEDKVDENQRLTVRLQSRMIRFVEKSSDSCMGCTICCLLALLGFLVFYT